MKRKLPTLANTLFLADELSNIERMIYKENNRKETAMESTQMTNLLFTLVKKEMEEADGLKEISVSLVHDMINIHAMCDIYTGDIHYLKKTDKQREEEIKAAQEIFEDSPHLYKAFLEYKEGSSREAQLAKQLVTLQAISAQVASNGQGWQENEITFQMESDFSKKMDSPQNEFKCLAKLRKRLLSYAVVNRMFYEEDALEGNQTNELLARLSTLSACTSRLITHATQTAQPAFEDEAKTTGTLAPNTPVMHEDGEKMSTPEEEAETNSGKEQEKYNDESEAGTEEVVPPSATKEEGAGVEEILPESKNEEIKLNVEKEAALKASTMSTAPVSTPPTASTKPKDKNVSNKERLAALKGLTE